MGQPRKYDNPEELESCINEYFNTTDTPTISGLSLFLGFESRQSFYDYEKLEGYSYTIKKARTRIESEYEKMLHRKEGQVTGAIFALKNLGWSDKVENSISGGLGIVWNETKTYSNNA